MKEKFRYRSKHFTTVVTVYLLVCFALMSLGFLLIMDVNTMTAGFVICALPWVSWIVVYVLLESVPSKFIAGKNFVEFKLLFKRINIRYSNIKNIEVTHEYAKPQIRGDIGGYKEIIKFVCRDGEYQFENIMNIDFEQTAADPESLSEQFERGKFMRLKNYISRQTGITY
ncbi:MAG: hypothetical protein K2H23_06695 [Oscillospiraceae bacterium]|nr:hypothetical protein [Oscillospiraceae bacterium]